MLLEELPSELLLEIFSYVHPSDLFSLFLPLSNNRLSYLISQIQYSVDLTYTSYSRYLLIIKNCLPSQIIFLRLTNQYSHSLLISEFFSSPYFRPEKFVQLRSLHLDDIIGNEINFLPSNLEKLYIKFHKKAKYALNCYRIALQSNTLKECYLIGGYAFDHTTCSSVSSKTIQKLHMAIKSFPNDLLVLLQALPSLTKLKTCIYNRSSDTPVSSSLTSPLAHLNIDLQTTSVNLSLLDSQLLSYLPRLQSLIYHSHGKSNEDFHHFIQLSTRIRRFKFIRKGLTPTFNIPCNGFHSDLVTALQEISTNNPNPRRLLTLHTIPYPDKVLHLPFTQWNKITSWPDLATHHSSNDEIYDRVERIRLNLSESFMSSSIPKIRHVNHLTLISNNEQFHPCMMSCEDISSRICLSTVRHLIINTQTSSFDFSRLLSLLSLRSLDIAWSQIRPDFSLSNIKILSLISECVSCKEIQYLINYLIPKLEHLQMNVTTSDECRKILNFLLSPKSSNSLISIKICICQTLSDQIKLDLEPLLLSSQWIKVKWKMDNWYLYLWK